jgi:hypothetical protein
MPGRKTALRNHSTSSSASISAFSPGAGLALGGPREGGPEPFGPSDGTPRRVAAAAAVVVVKVVASSCWRATTSRISVDRLAAFSGVGARASETSFSSSWRWARAGTMRAKLGPGLENCLAEQKDTHVVLRAAKGRERERELLNLVREFLGFASECAGSARERGRGTDRQSKCQVP